MPSLARLRRCAGLLVCAVSVAPVLRDEHGGRRRGHGWGPGLAAAQSELEEEEEEEESLNDLFNRCKIAKRPGEYGSIDRMEPYEIRPCASIPVYDVLGENVELTDIATMSVTTSAELLLLAQRRGPVYQLDVFTEGDRAHWDVMMPPTRTFRGHSCLNSMKFCDVSSVSFFNTGFWTVDRHRVMKFNFSWSPDEEEIVVGEIGQFNNAPDDDPELFYLLFPTAVATYKPLNESFFDVSFRITPLFPHAHAASELLFITDTGNHRVLMLNITGVDQLEVIGQFGVTGIAYDNSTGLDWPHGIAVATPAAEASFEPVIANVFVADRRNHRLVKLNVGYPLDDSEGDELRTWDALSLYYSGAYGGRENPVRWNETLEEPVGVVLFRHYVLVAEASGNAITLLKVHQAHFDQLIFVTQLTAAPGVQLTGHLAVSALGYVWYTYLDLPTNFAIGSFFLDEALRESPPTELLDDLAAQCYNDTWFHTDLLANESVYLDTLGYMLHATRVNWEYPELPGYLDIYSFNLTTNFDMDLLNETVFQGRLRICLPEEVSTTPAMLSGSATGWAGDAGVVAASAAASPRRTWSPWLPSGVLAALVAAAAPQL